MCVTNCWQLSFAYLPVYLQWVGSIDLAANDEASANIVVNAADTWVDQGKAVVDKVAEALEGNKVDAVLCVAGGWAGGNAASKGMPAFIYIHCLICWHLITDICKYVCVGLPDVRFLTGQSEFFGDMSGQKYDTKPDN